MQIENYIKELLYDYSKVVIPGLGAFLTSDKSAYINDSDGKIYPPTKDIVFNDNIKLDDSVLITKIKEEESISKDSAIESIQAYIEQLLSKLNTDGSYTINELGTFIKEADEYKLHFKQTDKVNYLSDIFNLPVIDLPPKVAAPQEDVIEEQEEVAAIETFENPHESKNNEILPELTQEQEPKFTGNEAYIEEPVEPVEVEEQQNAILEEENPYQDNDVVNEYISTEITVNDEPASSKSRAWLILIPLLLLAGLAFGLYNLFLKDAKTDDYKPALIKQQKPVENSNTITDTTKTEEPVSSNSAGALLQGKKNNTTPPKESSEVTATNPKTAVQTKTSPDKKTDNEEFYNGYYVVISSFEKNKEAADYSNTLRNKGYNAVILPNSNKYNRVAIYAGKSKADAEEVLPKYRKVFNEDAWVINFKN